MCFSATANFVGSGVLAAIGAVTFTHVKHRRELLFAALPTLFAIHQFIEGFVWLGLDGILSPAVVRDMGAAYMLYAQGFLPFLLPLSAIPDTRCRNHSLYIVGVDGVSIGDLRQGRQHRLHQSGDKQYSSCGAVCDCYVRFVICLQGQGDGNLRRGKPGNSPDCNGVQALRIHLVVVRLRCDREPNHLGLLLEKQRRPTVPVRRDYVAPS